jgi:hypothetical protein
MDKIKAVEDKIEAIKQGDGLIVLETDSADAVKQAIEKVSSIVSIDGGVIKFEGHRIIEGHGFALQVNCYDIFECSKGYLLHTYMDTGPNWAVTGRTLQETLDAAPDQRVARRAHGLLVQKNLISTHH